MNLSHLSLLILPLITAFIGWLTNWVAIKMLFEPKQPKRLLGFIPWQGLIPRRQTELAGQAADVIEREIMNHHIISSEIRKMDLTPYLEGSARRLVRDRIAPKLKAIPLLGGLVNEETVAKMENLAVEEVTREAMPVIEKIAIDFESSFNVKEIVEERITSFDLDKLEDIVMRVARREFRTIENLGAILGFVVGLVQLALLYALGNLQF